MDNYVQTILKEKEQQDKNILTTLFTLDNIPNLKNSTKKLPTIEELILKITYLHKIFFLNELVELFHFCYSRQQIEKIVHNLEETGYIKSQIDSEYGKCFTLTKNAIHFIKCNPATVSVTNPVIIEKKFPLDLISYKCKSRMTSFFVFNKQAEELYLKFKSEEKAYRTEYAKTQYIKHFLYKQFLQFSKSEKERLLRELGFSEGDIARYSSSRIFSNSFSDIFVNQYISYKDFQELDSSADYQKFRLAINKYCFKKDTRNFKILSHFLKDYQNLIIRDKKNFLKFTYQLVLDMKTTYKYNDIKEVINYLKENGNEDINIYQRELNKLLEVSKFLSMKKRGLINSTVRKSDKSVTELQTINSNIEELQQQIDFCQSKILFSLNHFKFMTYNKTQASGIMDFVENEITLNRLTAKDIYIHDIVNVEGCKNKVTFAIVQSNSDAFYTDALFQKIEFVFLYCYYVLKDYSYEFTIYTYGDTRKSDIELALKQVKDKFSNIREYAILSAVFDTVISVKDCKEKNQERYESYNFIKEEMDKLS